MSANKKRRKPAKKDKGIIDDAIGVARTSIFAGLGVAFLIEEPIEKLMKRTVKKGEGLTNDLEKLYDDVKKESIKARKDVEKRVKDLIDDIIPSNKKKSSGSKKKKRKPAKQ
jgi:polyhydroxyalkanoate synthesis regulator phasin